MPFICWEHVWVLFFGGSFFVAKAMTTCFVVCVSSGVCVRRNDRVAHEHACNPCMHACMHDSRYGVGKESPQHSTRKVLTIANGTRMDLVGILWGTGGEPGMFFGEPGFGGCLAP